jgi:hypothetical protein
MAQIQDYFLYYGVCVFCRPHLLHLAFAASAALFFGAVPALAASDASTAPVRAEGGEIYLYPGSEVDIDAYGRCAKVKNSTKDTIAPVAVTPASWPEFKTHKHKDKDGRVIMEVTPCR